MELVFDVFRFISDFRIAFFALLVLAILPVSIALIYNDQFDGLTSLKANSGKRLNAALFGCIIFAVDIIVFLLSVFMYYLYICFYY